MMITLALILFGQLDFESFNRDPTKAQKIIEEREKRGIPILPPAPGGPDRAKVEPEPQLTLPEPQRNPMAPQTPQEGFNPQRRTPAPKTNAAVQRPPANSVRSSAPNAFVVLFMMAIGACVYFLPTVIAVGHSHDSATPIAMINLLGGWLGFVWIGVLIWAIIGQGDNR